MPISRPLSVAAPGLVGSPEVDFEGPSMATPRLGATRRWSALLACCLGCGGVVAGLGWAVAPAADAAAPADLRGSWFGTFHPTGTTDYFVINTDISTEDFSTGAVTGTSSGIGPDDEDQLTGTVSGTIFTFTVKGAGYSSQNRAVIGSDGEGLYDDITDSLGNSGVYDLARNGPAPAGAAAPAANGPASQPPTSQPPTTQTRVTATQAKAFDPKRGTTTGPAPIARALPTPAQAFSSPVAIVVSAGVTIAFLLFITFPANLFNQTFEENYDTIVGAWRSWLARVLPGNRPRAEQRAAAESANEPGDNQRSDNQRSARERQRFFAVLLGGAVLGALLNPRFGANAASAEGFVATVLTILTGTAVGALVTAAYRGARRYDVAYHLEALPAGLVIAVICVLISRLSDFQPGYLYGIVCGVAFAGSLTKKESAHIVALGHLASITVAVIAWLVWIPVNHTAIQHPNFVLAIIDDFLGSVFVGGLVGSVISLIPVRFMPGHALASWHRGAWAATFGVATFGLIAVIVRPSSHNHAGGAPIVTTVVLLVAFGGGSLAFREYFARRERATATSTAETPATETPAAETPATETPAATGSPE
jgi:hypothetical protein